MLTIASQPTNNNELMTIMSLIKNRLISNPEFLQAESLIGVSCPLSVLEAVYPTRKDGIQEFWLLSAEAENTEFADHIWKVATDEDRAGILKAISEKRGNEWIIRWLMAKGLRPPADNIKEQPWLANFHRTDMPPFETGCFMTLYYQTPESISEYFRAEMFPDNTEWWLSPECLFAKVKTIDGLVMVTISGALLLNSSTGGFDAEPANSFRYKKPVLFPADNVIHRPNGSGQCEFVTEGKVSLRWKNAALRILKSVHDNNLGKLKKLMGCKSISRAIDYVALIPLLEYNDCLAHIIREKCHTRHHFQQLANSLENSHTSYYHGLLIEKIPQLRELTGITQTPFRPEEIDDFSFNIEYNHVLLSQIEGKSEDYVQDLLNDYFCSIYVRSGRTPGGSKTLKVHSTDLTYRKVDGKWVLVTE